MTTHRRKQYVRNAMTFGCGFLLGLLGVSLAIAIQLCLHSYDLLLLLATTHSSYVMIALLIMPVVLLLRRTRLQLTSPRVAVLCGSTIVAMSTLSSLIGNGMSDDHNNALFLRDLVTICGLPFSAGLWYYLFVTSKEG